MFNGNIYSFYLYLSVIVSLQRVVILQESYGKNLIISKDDESLTKVQLSAEDSGKQTYTLAKTLHRTFSEFEELFENILDILDTSVPKIARDSKIFLAKLSNHITHVLNTFSNKILNEGDNLLFDTFRNFEQQLEFVRIEFENLAKSIDEHFNWAVVQLNRTLINHTEEYDYWTAYIKQKLRTVNDTKLYQEGCHAIDAFIINSTKELHNCCKITMKPMLSLCNSASSLVNEALHTIVDVIDRMQTCLEEKNSYLDYMLPCINLAYNEVIRLVSRAGEITKEINNKLPIKLIYTRSCFAIVKVDMNVRRNNIESNLFAD